MQPFEEMLKMTGELRLTLTDEHGEVKQDIVVKNLVTTVGKGVIADRMKAAPAIAAMTHMAVGTNNTAAAAGDTTLGTELARVALTSTGVAGAVITYIGTFGPGVGTGALVEAGILNAGSGGSLLARTVFSVINKAAGDSLTITWTVTIN